MSARKNLHNLSDEKLMLLYQDGDIQAFNLLYERHKNRVYSYLNKRVQGQDAREEIFQNCFLKLHRFRKNYDPKHIFLKWLYTITRSEMLDYLKKKQLKTVPFLEQMKEAGDEFSPNIDELNLSSVSEVERHAIKLRFYSGQDYKEIAEALNISEPNARKIISRGIKKLKKTLLGKENEA